MKLRCHAVARSYSNGFPFSCQQERQFSSMVFWLKLPARRFAVARKGMEGERCTRFDVHSVCVG
jgi:hypothetical protein